jgi:hypothetical protein
MVDIELSPEFWVQLPQWEEFSAASQELGLDPEELLMTGGEDHAFIVTTSFPAMVGGIEIGKVVDRPMDGRLATEFVIKMGERVFTKDSTLGYLH